MKRFKDFLKILISAIYPNKCICCSNIIEEGQHLCSKCSNLIERNNLTDICLLCGHDKSECVCKYNVYRFNSLICVFKNTGRARKAYYSYKFLKRQHYAKFFASEMSKAVLECYKDIDFDFICSVPSSNRYGYDHSGYLAKNISRFLDLPYTENLMSCVIKTKKQHKSTIDERLTITVGKYKCKARIDDAKVLLVDDIKTTGSTLDECAKVLLFAGAKSVHCITILGASSKKN